MELSNIQNQIWDMKYRLKGVDNTIEDTWRRVAKHVASVEKHHDEWEEKFYGILEDFKFLPGGRILAGAGSNRNVTLFNCFVMGTIPDSLGGIFTAIKEAALTMQQGGGVGMDFSTLRPKGATVNGVGADASGPLSFMDVWDSMCKTIMSAGVRRGAMMAVIRCDHPDIEEFIEAKRDPLRLRNFNVSVLCTDDFMKAVQLNDPWDLVFNGVLYKTVSAKDLWDKIMRSTYEYAEPGVIFIDRINEKNNLNGHEIIYATNPCGEQPLPPYGACLLGSINLTKFVDSPFDEPGINYEKLRDTTRTAIRFLDNVVDCSRYPLPEQEREAKNKRRIGLGITGLADALIMSCCDYGATYFPGYIMKSISHEAYLTSQSLGKEKGNCLYVDRRNTHLTSIAPTGTISLLADNVSSGIEPVFAFEYTRFVTQKDGTKREEIIQDYAYKLWRDMYGNKQLPEYFLTTSDLKPKNHVNMQASIQEYVDSSISKTINCPEDIKFDDFKDVYMYAYDIGCKGCTTYRPNKVTGAVLEVKKDPVVTTTTTPEKRPGDLKGATYKIKWPDSDHAMYITINDKDGAPFEMFINSKNMEHYQWTVALTRMVSAVFRRGGDVSFVAEELKSVFDPRGGQWVNSKYVPSVLAAIGDVIEKHMKGTGFIKSDVPEKSTVFSTCPKCSTPNLVKKEGCDTCLQCGYSKCG